MVKKKSKVEQIQTIGRRKTSIARSTLMRGTGILRVNGNDLKEVVPNHILQMRVVEPLILAQVEGKVDFYLKVNGGGVNSQVDAIRQAIARGLVEMYGEDMKKTFAEYDRTLIVADTRFKETKKPNNSHARAKRQKSYR
ncbi:MAG: 30S ribosomal protein S9 [Candidatus Nanoarchaeia archaeon]